MSIFTRTVLWLALSLSSLFLGACDSTDPADALEFGHELGLTTIEDYVGYSDAVLLLSTESYSGTASTSLIPSILPSALRFGDGDLDIASYAMEVESVLYDGITDPPAIVVGQSRELGLISASREWDQTKVAPLVGQSYLVFVFADDPGDPNSTFSLATGGASSLIPAEDPGGPVTFGNGHNAPFGAGMTFSEFVDAVEDEIAAQYP